MSIELIGVTAGYVPGVDILNGLDMRAERGEIVTVVGPNGSGKSTSLKAAAGYLLPRKGEVRIEGKDVGSIPVDKRVREYSIAIVPQSDNVFGALSVWENLNLGGTFMKANDRNRRIDELAERYPLLRRKMYERAFTLSGGERQILAIARALMPSPNYLLLDEPSAGLSPTMLSEVFEAIVHLVQQTNIGVLLVEQNAVQALEISDRAYVLVLGKSNLTGTAKELLSNPRVRDLYLGGELH
ncbi:ABC transporter ATP-binding protein [Brucella anthropi]|uniref:ABC transporter ATP-binding protein n=1 Tax=Brucella anthropi TaxID=529 RepID=UPI000ADA8B92|nr:ABC transporter ATP-binding protein [Brucella anthropi]